MSLLWQSINQSGSYTSLMSLLKSNHHVPLLTNLRICSAGKLKLHILHPASDIFHLVHAIFFSQPETGSGNYVGLYVVMYVCLCVRCYLLILLQSFPCRGGIISNLCSLCRSQSLGTSHSTVCCTILSVERCSLGNTSLHRDEMTPPLQEYSSVLYYTIL